MDLALSKSSYFFENILKTKKVGADRIVGKSTDFSYKLV